MSVCVAAGFFVRHISYCNHADWNRMAVLSHMIMSAMMGACVGGGGVIIGSMVQVGRMPPRAQIGGAAGFMAFMLGVGSVVRQR